MTLISEVRNNREQHPRFFESNYRNAEAGNVERLGMSTYHAVQMTMADFIEAARAEGWTEGAADDGSFALVSPGGSYCHYIKEFDGNDLKGDGRTTWTLFARYGGNIDVNDLAEAVGAFCEHDDEWDKIS